MAGRWMLALNSALVGALVIGLAGCGQAPAVQPAGLTAAGARALDDPDHAQMNAIVQGVLAGQFKALLASCDTNHDGAIAIDEYKLNRSDAAVALFQAQFDTNHDGVVTSAEYDAALANPATVEAYHHFTEATMSSNLSTFLTPKKTLPISQLRPYMVTLGLRGDWPLIGKLSQKLDLNQDGQLLGNQAEGSAFLLTFAQPTLEHALGLPVTQLNLLAGARR